MLLLDKRIYYSLCSEYVQMHLSAVTVYMSHDDQPKLRHATEYSQTVKGKEKSHTQSITYNTDLRKNSNPSENLLLVTSPLPSLQLSKMH